PSSSRARAHLPLHTCASLCPRPQTQRGGPQTHCTSAYVGCGVQRSRRTNRRGIAMLFRSPPALGQGLLKLESESDAPLHTATITVSYPTALYQISQVPYSPLHCSSAGACRVVAGRERERVTRGGAGAGAGDGESEIRVGAIRARLVFSHSCPRLGDSSLRHCLLPHDVPLRMVVPPLAAANPPRGSDRRHVFTARVSDYDVSPLVPVAPRSHILPPLPQFQSFRRRCGLAGLLPLLVLSRVTLLDRCLEKLRGLVS
ncbi:hypothetical protein K438DRAFT_2082806, partial [Mycena galopus ATCC 62051]